MRSAMMRFSREKKPVTSECRQLRNGKKRTANIGSNWIGFALLFFRHSCALQQQHCDTEMHLELSEKFALHSH